MEDNQKPRTKIQKAQHPCPAFIREFSDSIQPCRFHRETKVRAMYSVQEFGYQCLLCSKYIAEQEAIRCQVRINPSCIRSKKPKASFLSATSGIITPKK